jgi:hypothetical protein
MRNFPAVFFLRPIATISELNEIERVKRQSRDLRQASRQPGLAGPALPNTATLRMFCPSFAKSLMRPATSVESFAGSDDHR